MFVATQLCLLSFLLKYLNKIEYLFNNWYTRETQPMDPFVLLGRSLFTIFPPEDRDHTDSRRIKPNSRTLLIGEQPNPSKLLHPGDRMSRHRGVKQLAQCVLSPAINLLSLA